MTTSLLLHPVLPYVLAAAIVPWVGVTLRRVVSLAAPLAALAAFLALPPDATAYVAALGHDWVLLRADGLGRVFALAFIIYSFIAAIFAWEEQGAGPKPRGARRQVSPAPGGPGLVAGLPEHVKMRRLHLDAQLALFALRPLRVKTPREHVKMRRLHLDAQLALFALHPLRFKTPRFQLQDIRVKEKPRNANQTR